MYSLFKGYFATRFQMVYEKFNPELARFTLTLSLSHSYWIDDTNHRNLMKLDADIYCASYALRPM